MKKEIVIFSLLFLFSISAVNILPSVSAQEFSGAEVLVLGIAESITGIYDAIRFDVDNSSKILLGILLWIILYSVVSQMKLFEIGNSGRVLSGIVALIITILTFILMPKNFIEAIVLQYGALGATILTVIPFLIMIYFTFKVTSNMLVAKIAWIFYVVYYFGLFTYKIVENSGNADSITQLISQNIPYVLAIIAGIVIFIFIKRLRIWTIQSEIETKELKGKRAVEKLKLLNKLKQEELKGYTEGL
jgi:hypothetical protein